MIKTKATVLMDGRKVYLLGLSEQDIIKLKAGKPLFLQLEELGGEGEVCIMYGETEADIATELADLIGSDI